jgi:hypothetical protein
VAAKVAIAENVEKRMLTVCAFDRGLQMGMRLAYMDVQRRLSRKVERKNGRLELSEELKAHGTRLINHTD